MEFNTTKDHEWFEHEMAINGLQSLLVSSHEEARINERENNIVYTAADSGAFDVYLVSSKDGVFTEYVCWTEEEFLEDDELVYTVVQYILGAFKGPRSVGENLQEMNPHIQFETIG